MTSPASTMIPIEDIDDTDRLRPVDPAYVAPLLATMEERGLDQPIVVRLNPRPGAKYLLVAGGHRLAAAKALVWEEIRAEIRELDDLQAKLVEIDENLIRHELTPLDRGLFLQERKRVYELLHPETRHGGDRKSPTWRLAKRFSAEAAESVGLSERTVQRAIEAVAGLTPTAIQNIRGSALVRNAVALKAIGDLPAAQQATITGFIGRGEARDWKQAQTLAGLVSPTAADPQEQIYAKLVELYGRANARTKRRFEEHAGLAIRAERTAA